MGRTVTAASFLTLGVVYLVMGFGYPLTNSDGMVAAGFFPRIIGACWVIAALSTLVVELRSKRATRDHGYGRDALEIGALTIAFIVSLALVGSIVSMALFTGAVLYRFNRGHAMINLVVAIALSVVVYVIFVQLFATLLPPGMIRGLP
jgi:divalent metal cation (Fe/Co/Zn/Cd) transporter